MAEIVVLTAGRRGDLVQMQDVAKATGLPFNIRHIAFRNGPNWRRSFNPAAYLVPSVETVFNGFGEDHIVLCAEAQVCAFVAKQKQAGGKFKAVCIGRPRGYFNAFDLIISSPHYMLHTADNLCVLPYPPHQIANLGKGAVEEPHNPPLHLCLVGNTSPPDMLDDASIVSLLGKLKLIAHQQHKRVAILLSPRTSADIQQRIREQTENTEITVQPYESDEASLYARYLREAASFTVTSDSVSMTVEAMLTGKPVQLHILTQQRSLAQRLVNWLWQQSWARFAFETGILEARPDRLRLYRTLEQQGLITTGEHLLVSKPHKAPASTADQAAMAILKVANKA
jgi:mitochondrial fission protein ELM1